MKTLTTAGLELLAYDIAAAVAVTGLGRSTLYEAIKDGSLKSVLRCGRRLILKDDLIAFLLGGEGAAAAEGPRSPNPSS